MVGKTFSIIAELYGEVGQSMVDRLLEILRTRNPAVSLLFVPEQKCFHIIGFPDMQDSECVEMLSQVKSDAFYLEFMGKTTQGIIISQLVPISPIRSEQELILESVQHQTGRRQRERISRSMRAIRAQAERLQQPPSRNH
jgi:hypothetical protein